MWMRMVNNIFSFSGLLIIHHEKDYSSAGEEADELSDRPFITYNYNSWSFW